MQLSDKKNLNIVISIIVLLVVFCIGVGFGKDQVICQTCPPEDLNFSLFWDVWKVIDEQFALKEKVDEQKLIYGAISGMVESLDDPYTVFMQPEETKMFKEDTEGSFEGVGMEIGLRDDQLQVIAPLKGTPAEKAGLKAGDNILKIGDKTTYDMSADEAISLIRGPKGTSVVLTIIRDGWEEPKEIKLVRSIITVPSMTWELKDGNIAYIRIYQFSKVGGQDFRKAALEILNSEADKIILDLRNNPGGFLEIAQEIAGWFLEAGQIVAIEDFGEGQEPERFLSEGNSRLLSYPIVVLIDKGTASGSEILAGALRDNRGVKLIGENSFGKGLVQQLINLNDGSSVKVTVAKWLTPKGESIQEKGLVPDIEIAFDENSETDNQLEKAIEVLKELQ